MKKLTDKQKEHFARDLLLSKLKKMQKEDGTIRVKSSDKKEARWVGF